MRGTEVEGEPVDGTGEPATAKSAFNASNEARFVENLKRKSGGVLTWPGKRCTPDMVKEAR